MTTKTLPGRARAPIKVEPKGISVQDGTENQLCVALILHKGQGSTVDRAFLLGSEALYREAGYTGMSRGRTANHLYMVRGGAFESDSHLPEGTARDEMGQLMTALGRSRAQSLASEERERARSLTAGPRVRGDLVPIGPGGGQHREERQPQASVPQASGPGAEAPANRWAELAQREREDLDERSRPGLARPLSLGDDLGR